MKEVVGYELKEKLIIKSVIVNGIPGEEKIKIMVRTPVYKDHGGNDHIPPTSFESVHWNVEGHYYPETNTVDGKITLAKRNVSIKRQ